MDKSKSGDKKINAHMVSLIKLIRHRYELPAASLFWRWVLAFGHSLARSQFIWNGPADVMMCTVNWRLRWIMTVVFRLVIIFNRKTRKKNIVVRQWLYIKHAIRPIERYIRRTHMDSWHPLFTWAQDNWILENDARRAPLFEDVFMLEVANQHTENLDCHSHL